jgi:hypothetical protein
MKSVRAATPLPLMALGLVALLAAMWAGLVRLGWGWPVLRPTLPIAHGPLMISGFLGTVIGVERAVALSALPMAGPLRRWTFAGPCLTGLGALALIGGWPGSGGPVLMTLGSLSLALVYGLIVRMQTTLFTITMAAGAVLWLVGNGLWLLGWPIYMIVAWWSGFLILTIAGERLELSRVLRPTRTVQALFVMAVGVFLIGLIISLLDLDLGVRLAGVGLVTLALWLLRYDLARRTVRKSGLTRFMAVCLLAGYGWLGIGGGLTILFGGVSAGFRYDAILHAVYVGFVISMIFGHAPIIFPAIIGRAMPYQAVFYTHLALLHLSLLLRIVGDLTAWLPARQWGGLLNVVALLLFLFNTVRAVRGAMKRSTAVGISLPEAG